MGDSLREQLLKAGFAPPRAQDKLRDRPVQACDEKRKTRQQKRSDEFDLARAYAIRAQAEKAEREAAQREAQKQAQQRKERRRRLHELLSGHTIAIPADAEHARHFEHAGKIRRVYVTAEQLAALNRGELGVVVLAGRFLLVTRETALHAGEIAEDAIALLVDPNAASNTGEDGVPDDLMW